MCDRISFKELFKIYNFVSTLFRSETDQLDNIAKKTVYYYQNTSVSSNEEKFIKSLLKDSEKKITAPYTLALEDNVLRLYLIENNKANEILSDCFSWFEPYQIQPISTFSEYKVSNILVINREQFRMKDMYDNINDKRNGFNIFLNIFDSIIRGISSTSYHIEISTLLALLFLYQVTGKNISEEEFVNMNELEYDHEKDSYKHIYKIVRKIDKIQEDHISVFPCIDKDEIIQCKIANLIEEEFGWFKLQYELNSDLRCLSYTKKESEDD